MRRSKISAKQLLLLRHKEIAAQENDASRQAKAGWYYDPEKEAKYRYWTGSRWSDHLSTRLRHDHPPVEEPVERSIWSWLKTATGRG